MPFRTPEKIEFGAPHHGVDNHVVGQAEYTIFDGELPKPKFLHHVSEAPRTLSEMSQNPAALKNGRVASSTRTLERRSQREITTSWD